MRASSADAIFLPEPVSGELPPGSTSRTEIRRYRADAAILFLGMPVFRRSGVGGGQASIEETANGASTRKTLFFAAGSDPKHAQGLSRLGWMREVAQESSANPGEIAYFGVLSSSPEDSLDRARKSISAPPSGQALYNAVSGRNAAGRSRSGVARFEFPADIGWSDERLIHRAQSAFQSNVQWRETSWPNSPSRVLPTFLSELAALLKQRAGHAEGRYIYNEQEYRLELDASKNSSGGRSGPLPVEGKIRNQRTGVQTAFKLWLENSPDSVVPVRIQFQPRSFLRLTFEAVPA